MRSLKRAFRGMAMMAPALVISCGSPANPTAGSTGTATPAPTYAATATPSAAPASTAAATGDELNVVASMMYPACTPASCAGDAMFTTCDAGSSGLDVFAACPLTARLVAQLRSAVDGVVSAPDPLGGGQDPEWTTKSVITTPSPTGGIAHVVLGSGAGNTTEKYDLVVIVQSSQLLVDDIYCTGKDPTADDVYAAGWATRSVCTAH
ncbi:MAG: hypothetical protein WAW53_07595 [Candidatus Dormiibacterota bacterium]